MNNNLISSKKTTAAQPLSNAQIEQFRRLGYLVAPGLFTDQEASELRDWAEEVQSWPERRGGAWMYFEQGADGQRQLNRMERIVAHHAGFASVAADARTLGACAQLFGEEALLFKDKINFKLPGGGGFEAHQDVQAGWARYGQLHITALVTIDPATKTNGCLEMASGLHDRGLIGSEWKPLSDEDLAGAKFESIEAQPGDMVFFDSFAPHRSAPNHSEEKRRVLYLTYGKAADGDQLERYYADKFASYPPDIERETGRDYRYRV